MGKLKDFLTGLLLSSVVVGTISGCGPSDYADEISDKNSVTGTSEFSEESAESETEIETETEIEPETVQEETTEEFSGLQSCHKTIDNPAKPELTGITLTAECDGNLRKNASVEDVYNVNVLHSGVVGLVGVPVEFDYNETVTSPHIDFTYNRDELRGVPEKNLIVLHYNEKDSFYDTIESELDTENCTVSFDVPETGAYMLADAFQWYSCWGEDVSEYAYEIDPAENISDWERECETGDIMKLADKEWAVACEGAFSVDSPEKLASAVWYVNATGEPVAITLESDIDLSGYDWKPMGWSKNAFSGAVMGNGHVIKNMTIKEGYADTGFIGYGLSTYVGNINFTDADVSATGCTGIVGGQVYMSDVWEDIHVSGRVSGGIDDYGAIIGREAGTTFKDCSAEVTVDGEPFEYLSYRQKREDEVEIVETFTLTMDDDHTVTRDEHDGFDNLGWMILKDGVQVLHRNAEDELSYQYFGNDTGDYTIYLVAYINGTYIRVSNIIEYTI